MEPVISFPTKEQTKEFLEICNRVPNERIKQVCELARDTYPKPAPEALLEEEKFLFNYSQQELAYVLSVGGVLDSTVFE